MATLCNCCAERDGRDVFGSVPTPFGLKEVRSVLCQKCVREQHTLGACKLCGAATWHCARLAHMSLAHASVLEKVANAPEPRKRPSQGMRRIGRLRL